MGIDKTKHWLFFEGEKVANKEDQEKSPKVKKKVLISPFSPAEVTTPSENKKAVRSHQSSLVSTKRDEEILPLEF